MENNPKYMSLNFAAFPAEMFFSQHKISMIFILFFYYTDFKKKKKISEGVSFWFLVSPIPPQNFLAPVVTMERVQNYKQTFPAPFFFF